MDSERRAILEIEVKTKDATHFYVGTRAWGTSDQIAAFTERYHLMWKEEHICFGGRFYWKEEQMIDGKKKKVYTWEFGKLKTKNACLSYFKGYCQDSYASIKKRDRDALESVNQYRRDVMMPAWFLMDSFKQGHGLHPNMQLEPTLSPFPEDTSLPGSSCPFWIE